MLESNVTGNFPQEKSLLGRQSFSPMSLLLSNGGKLTSL